VELFPRIALRFIRATHARINRQAEPGGDTRITAGLDRLPCLNNPSERDVAAGMTLTGPHRDDVQFILDGFEASGFASRAQQRTIALSLRLAEARFLTDERGDSPILLLDDILSEMDANRRRSVLAAIGEVEQMLVTGTDLDRFEDGFLAVSSLYLVEKGSVRPVDGVSRGAEKEGS